MGAPRPETRQRHGHFVETLAELASDIRLLVMGRQGEEHQAEQDIGSHLESAIRRLSCRILITPATFKPPEQALVAYDASPTAHKVLEIIAQSPLFKKTPLHLVMVGEASDSNQQKLEKARGLLANEGHMGITAALISGEVEEALLSYVDTHGLDIIVMGAYGHSRIRQFLVGSTTSNLLRQSPVPVLLMRQ
ncbi:MAG TPA: universal stress protein [Wenzhouxiangella sp.]